MDYCGIDIDVVQADVFDYSADVLVLKYAQASYGVDAEVAAAAGVERTRLPQAGGRLLLDGAPPLAYRHLLFLGVEPLDRFNYRRIRDFAKRALESAAGISVREITMTLHGAGYGLDEIEAFESEVAGIVEVIDSGRYPKSLLRVTIIEWDRGRADRMRKSLAALLKPVGLARDSPAGQWRAAEQRFESRRVDSVGYDSASRPHAFVAMPFDGAFNDVFHYGISQPIRAAGLLCERMDQISFTGDVVDRMKERIASAALVIADLSLANPNVYLEIGYAWGVEVPCVLICNQHTELKFDLQGHRYLRYGSIIELEQVLAKELRALAAGRNVGPPP